MSFQRIAIDYDNLQNNCKFALRFDFRNEVSWTTLQDTNQQR